MTSTSLDDAQDDAGVQLEKALLQKALAEQTQAREQYRASYARVQEANDEVATRQSGKDPVDAGGTT